MTTKFSISRSSASALFKSSSDRARSKTVLDKLNKITALEEMPCEETTKTVYITEKGLQEDSTNSEAPQMEIANSIALLLLLSAGIGVAQNASGGGAHEVHVGVILDLGSLVGKIAITSISLALEDFYAAHHNYSTKLVLHIRDSMSDDVRAASQGRYSETLRYAHYIAFTCCFFAAE